MGKNTVKNILKKTKRTLEKKKLIKKSIENTPQRKILFTSIRILSPLNYPCDTRLPLRNPVGAFWTRPIDSHLFIPLALLQIPFYFEPILAIRPSNDRSLPLPTPTNSPSLHTPSHTPILSFPFTLPSFLLTFPLLPSFISWYLIYSLSIYSLSLYSLYFPYSLYSLYFLFLFVLLC